MVPEGLEPPSPVCETGALPLSYETVLRFKMLPGGFEPPLAKF